jgi:flagellar basal-body rod protein FlgF
MSASLYTSMAGLQALNARMEAVASNLANQQTPGYAAVQAMTEAGTYTGSNPPPGADAIALTPGPNITQGSVQETGNPLDVALGGDAWLQVQTVNGNALTRDGALALSAAGILTDSSGNPVLSSSGAPISLPPLAKLEIGTDGTVSGIPAATPGAPAQNFGQIALVTAPGTSLTALSGTLYQTPANAPATTSTNGTLHQGFINGSNVDPTQAMVEMISDSRAYQLQTNAIKASNTGTSGADLNQLLAQG